MAEDTRDKWDYWENRRHQEAHRENQPGCLGMLMCFLFILLMIAMVVPLMIISIDFYGQEFCRKGWLERACNNQKIIGWPR